MEEIGIGNPAGNSGSVAGNSFGNIEFVGNPDDDIDLVVGDSIVNIELGANFADDIGLAVNLAGGIGFVLEDSVGHIGFGV